MNYLIRVRSLNNVDGDETCEEIITHAELEGNEDDYTITYEEETDNCQAQTTVRVLGGECVTVRRTAEIQTDMVIEAGIKHISEHRLPFVSFNLEVIGSRIVSRFTENGAELKFAYTTYQDNMIVGKAEFDMTVKKKGRISKGL